MILIVLLLNAFTIWCQDSTKVLIDINAIRAANVKLIEREYLIKINETKDSIIDFKDSYIEEQKRIIGDFQDKLVESERINSNLRKANENTKWIASFTGGVALTCIAIIVVVCSVK